MATLTNFTKPADPLNAEDLRSWIATQTSKTITGVMINPSTIDVTGTIVSGDTSAIQTAINSYVYSQHAGDAGWLMLDDGSMANASRTKASSQRASYAADVAVLAVANSKADAAHTHTVANVTGLQGFLDDKAAKDDNLKIYLAGVKKNQPKMAVCTGTVSSGTVTFNLTDDNTSSGNALFTNVYLDSVQAEAYGTQVFFGSPTLVGNKKTISFPASQITSVLGILGIQTAANGISCRLMILGD